jgi:TatD DNase family protein
MYFDTHAHANFAKYGDESDEVIKRALDEGTWMVNVGTAIETSRSCAELALKYDKGVYATIGLHPGHTWQGVEDPDESEKNMKESFDEAAYQALLNDRVVAIGEIGLDYFRLPEGQEGEAAKDLQKTAFIEQLKFAQKHNLPVVIHCRDAYEDCLDIMKAEYKGGAIMHSYTGDWETAKKFVDMGFYVALNGILMFDKTGRLKDVCEKLPSDRILSETDAPYLAPPPYRGKRNEPSYVRYIVEHMAMIRGVPADEMAKLTFENALSVYRIGK